MTTFKKLLIENENTREILALAANVADTVCSEFAQIEGFEIDAANGRVRWHFIEEAEDQNATAWEASCTFHNLFTEEARMFHPELF